MLQDSPQNNVPNRKRTRTSSQFINPNLLKPLLQLVDQKTFQQNLQELQQSIGLKKINPDSQTFQDLRHYLKVLLSYPNQSLARLHRQSHRLGNFDLQILSSHYSNDPDSKKLNMVQQLQNCPCCGLRKQQQELKICSIDFQDMEMVGISAYMFFRTIRNVISFLFLALIVFGVYSFVSNIHTSNLWKEEGREDLFKNTIMISLGSKIYLATQQDYTDFLIWQVWLGFAFVILLMFSYLWMEYIEVQEIGQIVRKIRTVTDYSIVLKGVPIDVKLDQIQWNLNQICGVQNQSHHQGNSSSHRLKVVKINTANPSRLQKKIKKQQKQQLQQIEISISKFRKQIISWVKQLTLSDQFSTPRSQRKTIEIQYLQKLQQKDLKVKQIVSKVKSIYRQKGNYKTNLTHCYITFQSTKQKEKALQQIQHIAFEKFLNYLSFSIYKKTEKMRFGADNQEYDVEIQQAQEPQDVLWQNIGLSSGKLFIRKCITAVSTILVLGASFGVVYGLSTVQTRNQQNTYISFLISMTIVLFNVIINIVLRVFTYYEKNTSYTEYESSFAVKSIFAQMINTIVIPILVNRFLKQENYLYTKSGLAEDIFLLGLTNAFVTPLLKVFDIEYLIWKYVYVSYYSRPEKKFWLDQIQLNKIHELTSFQSGYEYIYVISVYLWTCFFMSLQPIVIVFSMAGFFMNYWAQKYSLFHKCKRPVPGTVILYNVMVQFVYAGGLFYSLGSLTFINLLPKDVLNTEPKFSLIANILSVAFGVISLFIPYSYIYGRWLNAKDDTPDCFYEDQRILFASEYDRANPATSDNAIEDYLAYLNKKKVQIQNKLNKNQVDKQIVQLFTKLSNQAHQCQMSSRKQIVPYNSRFENIRQNLFVPYIQGISSKQIENYLLADLFQNVNGNQTQPFQQIRNVLDGNLRNLQKQKSGSDNLITNVFEKELAIIQEKDKHKPRSQNPQTQHSLQRLYNDELSEGGTNQAQNRQRKIYQQSQININASDSLWQTAAAGIRQQVPHHENPIINPLNYSTSPYNPPTLQNFKLQTNSIYSCDRIQSQTGKSYKNINQAIRIAKNTLKHIPQE